MAHVLVLNGPNLNLLGTREPEIYGRQTLTEINTHLQQLATSLGHVIECEQYNSEGELIHAIHQAKLRQVAFIIINPAALGHTSIALRDALIAVAIPFIEIHLSNIYRRESFRHHSYLSDIAVGMILGLGAQGYELALRAVDHHLS